MKRRRIDANDERQEYEQPDLELTTEELAQEENEAKVMLSNINKYSVGRKFKQCIDPDAFSPLNGDLDKLAQSIADDWFSLFDGDGGDKLLFNKTTEFHLKHAKAPTMARQLFTHLVEATATRTFQPKHFETQRTQPFVNILLLLAFEHLRCMVSGEQKLMLWCEAKFDDRNAVDLDNVLFGRSQASSRFSDQSLFVRETDDDREGYSDFDRVNAVSTVECKRTLSKPDVEDYVDELMCEAALLGCERDGLFVCGQHVRQEMRVHDAIITDGVAFYRVRIWWEYGQSVGKWHRNVIVSRVTSLRPIAGETAPTHAQLLAVAQLLVGSVYDGLKREFKPTNCLQKVPCSWRDNSHVNLLEFCSRDSVRVTAKWQFVSEGENAETFNFVSKVVTDSTISSAVRRSKAEVEATKRLSSLREDGKFCYLTLPEPLTLLKLSDFECDFLLVFRDAGEPLRAQYVGGERGRQLASAFQTCIIDGALHLLHSNNLVHNDVHAGNVLVRKNGDAFTMTLIDFESMTSAGASLEGVAILCAGRPWPRERTADANNDLLRAGHLRDFLNDVEYFNFVQFDTFLATL